MPRRNGSWRATETRGDHFIVARTSGLAALRHRKVRWSAILLVAVHAFVIAYEEPTLSRLFGDEYENYRRTVGRWIPRWPQRCPLEPAASLGDADRLDPVPHADLGDRRGEVVPDGPLGEEQLGGDLSHGRAITGRDEHVPLPPGEW